MSEGFYKHKVCIKYYNVSTNLRFSQIFLFSTLDILDSHSN